MWCWIVCSEKGELKASAAARVDQITAELQTASSDGKLFNPVERMKQGFVHFKKEKYEFVFLFISFYLLTHNSIKFSTTILCAKIFSDTKSECGWLSA